MRLLLDILVDLPHGASVVLLFLHVGLFYFYVSCVAVCYTFKNVNLNNNLCTADLWQEEKSVADSSFQVEGSKPLITKNKYNNQNANNLQSIPCRENIWTFFVHILQ